VCGDARDPSIYARLLASERVDLLWTDPPYGVDYEGKTAAALRIEGDTPASLSDLLNAAFAAVDRVLKIYICHPSGERSVAFIEAFLAPAWRLHQELVWLSCAISSSVGQ
jgi:site-specific DNA-methyltransferase (adenine-specific)